MLSIQRFWSLIRKNVHEITAVATVFQIIIAIVMAALANYGPKIGDVVFGPGPDFVYWVEKVPGSKNSIRASMKKSMDMSMDSENKKSMSVSRRHYLDPKHDLIPQENKKPMSPEEQKEFETFISQMADKTVDMIQLLSPAEIFDDYIRIFVLTNKELSKINFLFQGCAGYSKHIAIPVSSGYSDANDNGITNPSISVNGAYYRYGQLKQGSNLELKIGFEDIKECTTTVSAVTVDGKQVDGKEVTARDYWEYKKQIDAGISRYLRYSIPLFSIAVFVITLTLLRYAKRITALEQKFSKRQPEEKNSDVDATK